MVRCFGLRSLSYGGQVAARVTAMPIKIVITGLDPVIHLLRKGLVTKIDGCPDQVRA
jgi:hypothetical protein